MMIKKLHNINVNISLWIFNDSIRFVILSTLKLPKIISKFKKNFWIIDKKIEKKGCYEEKNIFLKYKYLASFVLKNFEG